MKFSRNKRGLVVTAMILALTLILSGCTTPADNTDNKTPDFLEVGGSYRGTSPGLGLDTVRFIVVEIRSDGWILGKVNPDMFWWINTTQLLTIEEIERLPWR